MFWSSYEPCKTFVLWAMDCHLGYRANAVLEDAGQQAWRPTFLEQRYGNHSYFVLFLFFLVTRR